MLHFKLDVRCNAGGHAQEGQWHCHRWGPDKPLKWELRRVLPLFGFKDTAHVTLHHRMQEWRGPWAAMLTVWGLQPAQHMGDSSTSLLRRRELDARLLDKSEKEYWVSSTALIGLAAHFITFRRARANKLIAKAVAADFYEQVWSAEDTDTLLGIAPPPEILQSCDHGFGPDYQCDCLRAARANMRADNSPQATLLQKVLALQAWPDCKPCMWWLEAILTAGARLVDLNANRWGAFDPTTETSHLRGRAARDGGSAQATRMPLL